jgi:uncharacterized protein (TIGR02611 family)
MCPRRDHEDRRPSGISGLRERVRSTRTGRLTLQILVGLIGTIVVVIGIILIPFPGPGWLIVLAGLAILALEFQWAQRLLQYTRDRLERWWHWLGRQHWTVRILAGLVGLVIVAGVVILSLRYGLGVRSWSDLWN